MRRRLIREQAGFTLVEVLVTMVMMLTVMFALYSIFDMSLRVFTFGNDKTEAVQNARLGSAKMEREIRAAYPVDKANGDTYLFFNANGSSSHPPSTMPNSDQVTFGNDLDGDRMISCPNTEGNCEYITYRLSGGSSPALLRNNTANGSDSRYGGDPAVESVKANGLTFEYLDRSGTPVSSESDIRIVRITLDIKVNKGSQTLTTDVALRNRGG